MVIELSTCIYISNVVCREPRRQAILRKYEDPSVWETKSEDVVIRRTEGYAAMEKRMKERHIDLCSVNSGEVIGDTEILMNLSTYLYTIKCTANTEVFILDTKNFERLVGKKNMNTLDVIREYVKSKLKTRIEMQNGHLVPLLPYLHFKLTEQTLPVEKPLPPLKISKQLPDKEYQTKQLLNLFKEGKAVLVEPLVPGVHYYKELMLEKAKARERNRSNDEMTATANIRAMKRNPRKQPRSLMAIRESLREMMEAEVIQMDTQKSKRKLKRMKKHQPMHTLPSEQPSSDNPTVSSIVSISDDVKGKKLKLKRKSDKLETANKHESSDVPADSNNNNIAKTTPRKSPPPQGEVMKDQAAVSPKQPEVNFDSKRKYGKPVLVTEMKRSELDLPAIHEENTEEEIQIHSPITKKSPKRESPKINKSRDVNNTQNSIVRETKEDFEILSHRLENIDTVMGLEKQSEEGKRLILPPLQSARENKSTSNDRGSEEESEKWNTAMKFVNKRIQNRLATTSLADAPDTYDFESSEPTLRLLESRIQAFHIKYGGKARKTMKLPKLARFDTPVSIVLHILFIHCICLINYEHKCP